MFSNMLIRNLPRLRPLVQPLQRRNASILIKGGEVVNADRKFMADVRINGIHIEEIGKNLQQKNPSEKIIDGSNSYVIPGGIDTHTHLGLKFMGEHVVDDFDSGTRAALAGGTTTVCEFIIPDKDKNETLLEAYDRWMKSADGNANCDYAFHMAVTSWSDQVSEDMGKIVEKGITSFKSFLAYKGLFQLTDEEIIKCFSRAKELGALSMVHAENGDLCKYGQEKMLKLGITGPEGHYMSRPDEVEGEATHRAITIASIVNTPLYIVHVMSRLAAQEIGRAREKGLRVYGEPIAAGLGTDGRKYWDESYDVAAGHVMGPPLNPDPTVKQHLMNCLKAGILQTVGTDNCTFSTDQKRLGEDNFTKIPNGVNGTQHRLSVVWTKGVETGLLTPSEFVKATSTNASQIFNMYPRIGVIAPNSLANLVLWPKNAEGGTISAATHQHAGNFNIFEGMKLVAPEMTISRGEVVWEKGEFTENIKKGSGQFIHRDPFGAPFEGLDRSDAHNNPLNRKVNRVSENVTESDKS